MSGTQATATGTLGTTPLGNLLIYSFDRALTGTIVFEDPGGRKAAITIRSGVPAKAKIPEATCFLADVLVATEELAPDVAAELRTAAERDSRPFGLVAVERAAVTASALGDALAEQLIRKLEIVSSLPAASVYGYYDGVDFLDAYGPKEGAVVDPLSAIWRVLRASTPAAVVERTLSRLGTREVRLHPRSRVGRFGFDPKERGVVDVLRVKPQPVSALIESGIAEDFPAKRVLYGLVVTRHVDLGTSALPLGVNASASFSAFPASSLPAARPAAPEPKVPPAAPAPAALSAQADELRAELERRLQDAVKQSYYEMLGVDARAGATQIQAAFFQLAKRWHPDRLGPELVDQKDRASRLFAKLTEAHQTLSNDEQRKEYDRLVKEGGGSADEQEEVQRVLRAVSSFQKAEVLARRGNLSEAEGLAQQAVENDPDQPEYVALFADILSQKPERAQSGQYRDLLQMVTEAKRRQPANQRIWLYRARILKRAGDAQGAYAEFRAVAEADPHNVDAAREVRLHQMRRGTDPRPADRDPKRAAKKPEAKKEDEKGASKDIGAMFGKFFKR